MSIPSEAWVVIGALGGAFIAGTLAVLNSYFTQKSEERKHFRDTIMKIASENWNKRVDTGTSGVIAPLPIYIIHAAKMCEIAFDKNVTASNVQSKLSEIDALMDILHTHAVNDTKKIHQPK